MLLLRLFAFIIDGMIVFLPSWMICFVLNSPSFMTVLLPQIIFVVYNVICVSSFKGKTLGKFFSKLIVYIDQDNLLFIGMREVAKLLYFLPTIGLFFFAISLITFLFSKKTLHDLIGQSTIGFSLNNKGVDHYERNILR